MIAELSSVGLYVYSQTDSTPPRAVIASLSVAEMSVLSTLNVVDVGTAVT